MSYKLEIHHRDWDHPDSALLRQCQRDELAQIYGQPDGCEPGAPPSADDIAVFVVAYLVPIRQPGSNNAQEEMVGPLPIACGGLRLMSGHQVPDESIAGDAEIKRMYVRQDYRGKPWEAAKSVLLALEQSARESGWTMLLLETGHLQKAAIRFYQRQGYNSVPKFGAYINSEISLCFAKRI